ncbi:MAG: hypothetical protein JWP69_2155 [Flaviaesturariibacter sp.]|nr:hypothetical protein [Flaviaesturariibacter sp.]
MLTALFCIFLAYILYRFIFHFVVPIWRTTRQVKRGFRDMQERMNSQMGQYGQPQEPARHSAGSPSKPKQQGDYIDFEEVKE